MSRSLDDRLEVVDTADGEVANAAFEILDPLGSPA
jgi:hypothetical protein